MEKKARLKTGTLEVVSTCKSAKGIEEICPIALARMEHHSVSVAGFGAAAYTLDL